MKGEPTNASLAQLSYLTHFMRENKDMALGQISHGYHERTLLSCKWQILTGQLNALVGPDNTVGKWKQVWRNLKSNFTKPTSKKRELRSHNTKRTDNRPSTSKGRLVKEKQISVKVEVKNEVITEPAQIDRSPVSSQPKPTQPKRTRPLPVPPESGPSNNTVPISREEAFDTKFLSIQEGFLELKKERNAIEQRRNIIAQEKNDALNRIADILERMM